MANLRCPICFENYNREYNPPHSTIPCSHNFCKPCLLQSLRRNRNCPICRQIIQNHIFNRSMMELIEDAGHQDIEASDNTEVKQLIEFSKITSKIKRSNEVLLDKCTLAVYILDNSMSMGELDGKIFTLNTDGTISKKMYLSRWSELSSKILKIAKYNMVRGMTSVIYLLNPGNSRQWLENKDYVIINPKNNNSKNNNSKNNNSNTIKHNVNADGYIDVQPKYSNLNTPKDKMTILDNILSPNNIRGNTPLDKITEYFSKSLHQFIQSDNYRETPVCFNILTDGEPNDRFRFESKLRELVNKYHMFLTINMCTENDNVVEYYNNLDRKFGKELSGMDVVDDLESEQKEVMKVGNTFIVYSHDIHVARMAGCYSKVVDLLDEEQLSNHHMTRICKELCGNYNMTPHWSNRTVYLKFLGDHNIMVYDFYYGYMRPLFNISEISRRLWIQEHMHAVTQFYTKIANPIENNTYVSFMIVITAIFITFWVIM